MPAVLHVHWCNTCFVESVCGCQGLFTVPLKDSQITLVWRRNRKGLTSAVVLWFLVASQTQLESKAASGTSPLPGAATPSAGWQHLSLSSVFQGPSISVWKWAQQPQRQHSNEFSRAAPLPISRERSQVNNPFANALVICSHRCTWTAQYSKGSGIAQAGLAFLPFVSCLASLLNISFIRFLFCPWDT